MSKKKQEIPKIVIYFTRTSIVFIAPELEILQTFPLGTDIVKDLDIINKDLFSQQLKLFIEQIGLQPATSIMIFDPSVYFLKENEVIENSDKTVSEKDSKEAKQGDPDNEEKEDAHKKQLKIDDEFAIKIKKLMPYENSFVKEILIGSTKYTIAVNRNFYEPVLSNLTEMGFFVTTLIPSLVIQDILEGQQFTLELGAQILQTKSSVYKKHNFLSHTQTKTASDSYITRETPDKKKIIALGSLFISLIGVLIYMVINMEQIDSPPPAPVQPLPIQIQPPPSTPIPQITENTASASASIEEIDFSAYTVQVLNGSGKTGQAGKLKEILLDNGFVSIDTGNTATLTASKAVVVFDENLPEEVKLGVVEILSDTGLVISTINGKETAADISITTVVSSTLLETP